MNFFLTKWWPFLLFSKFSPFSCNVSKTPHAQSTARVRSNYFTLLLHCLLLCWSLSRVWICCHIIVFSFLLVLSRATTRAPLFSSYSQYGMLHLTPSYPAGDRTSLVGNSLSAALPICPTSSKSSVLTPKKKQTTRKEITQGAERKRHPPTWASLDLHSNWY